MLLLMPTEQAIFMGLGIAVGQILVDYIKSRT